MKKVMIFLQKLVASLVDSVRRFPESIVISIAFVVVMIINNRMDYDTDQALEKLALILALGIPLSVCTKLVIERMKSGLIFRLILDFGVIIYGVLFRLWIPEDLNEKFMIRYAFASAAVYLLFTLIPYFGHIKNYGKYLVKLITSFLITYLYTLVLYFGTIAIIFAIDTLFAVDIAEEIYFDLFITAVGVFGLIYYLASVPQIEDDISEYRYPAIWRVLFVNIVIPLISVYTLVLLVYFANILIVFEWPKGMVAQLVLWYGFVSIALLMVVEPLKGTNRIVHNFRKYYPVAMVIPLMMLIASVMIRIDAYGVTTNRALIVMAWVWFLLVDIYLIVRKEQIHQNITVAFILITVIAVFGPINVFSVSISSQTSRLEQALEKVGMYDGDQITANPDLTLDEKIDISSKVAFLDELEAASKVRGINDDFELKDMEEVFGFKRVYSRYVSEGDRQWVNFYSDVRETVDISTYSNHLPLKLRNHDWEEGEEEKSFNVTRLDYTDDHNVVEVFENGSYLLTLNLDELFEENGLNLGIAVEEQQEAIRIESVQNDVDVLLMIQEINGVMGDGALVIEYLEGDLYW